MKALLLLTCLSLAGNLAGANLAKLGTQSSARLSTIPPWFGQSESVGNLTNTWTEYSGLAPGQRAENIGYLWAIEDGATAYILAISKTNATPQGQVTLSGVSTSDVEDLDSFTYKGQPYVIVADVGDNGNARSTFDLIRCKEPAITGGDFTLGAGEIEQIVCEFPSGDIPTHKDVEGVFGDPHTGDIYVVTKRVSPVKLYRLNYATSYAGTQTLDDVGDLTAHTEFNTISTTSVGANGYVTGAAISPNGSQICLRSYDTLWMFNRNLSSQTIIQALQTDPTNLVGFIGGGLLTRSMHPWSEPQGEAVCFDQNGWDLWHCSESVTSYGSGATNYPLFKMERKTRPATTWSFQQGTDSYTGGGDTYIDSGNAAADLSATATTICDWDWTSYPTTPSRYRIGLHQWDVTDIPTTATVISAKLDMYINTEGLGITAHRLLTNWTADSSATWNAFGAGDIRNDSLATATPAVRIVSPSASTGWNSWVGYVQINLPPDLVQEWVTTPATNHGLAIHGADESTGDGLQFRSNNHGTTANRPKLTILTTE